MANFARPLRNGLRYLKCRILLYFQLAELAFLLWDCYVLSLEAGAGITISTG